MRHYLVAMLFVISCHMSGQENTNPLQLAGEVTCECISNIEKGDAGTIQTKLQECLSAGSLAYQLAAINNQLIEEKETNDKKEEYNVTIGAPNSALQEYVAANCPYFSTTDTIDFSEDLKIVSKGSCECIATISTALPIQEKNDLIQECIAESTTNRGNGEIMGDVENLRSFLEAVQSELVNNCEALELVTFADDEEKLNSYSYNEKAIEFYNKGQQAYEEKKLNAAARFYKKAVEVDKEFVFAWDNLGRTYRELNKIDEAIDAYQSSLNVDPLNRTALMNIAVAYNYKEDIDNTIKYYEILKAHYPKDPESPYGLALAYWQKGDLDISLTNALEAFKLYKSSKSPYQADAQKVINYLYADFEKANRTAEFKKICKENNIDFGL